MAIVTLANTKTYLGYTDTSKDSQLTTLIAGVQAELERYTGRTFDSGTFTEYYDGGNASSITLHSPPVTSITSVSLVSIDRTVQVTLDSTTYYCDPKSGVLSRRGGGSWYTGWADSDWSWGMNTDSMPTGYINGDAPRFSDRTFQGVKVIYVGGYTSQTMPSDLQLLMYDLVATRLAMIGRDLSLSSEKLGNYAYVNGPGSWWAPFENRMNAWRVYT